MKKKELKSILNTTQSQVAILMRDLKQVDIANDLMVQKITKLEERIEISDRNSLLQEISSLGLILVDPTEAI